MSNPERLASWILPPRVNQIYEGATSTGIVQTVDLRTIGPVTRDGYSQGAPAGNTPGIPTAYFRLYLSANTRVAAGSTAASLSSMSSTYVGGTNISTIGARLEAGYYEYVAESDNDNFLGFISESGTGTIQIYRTSQKANR
jgi:hypothetical protein